jgi:hypothetical protein
MSTLENKNSQGFYKSLGVYFQYYDLPAITPLIAWPKERRSR